jgi:hypothetical protein
MKRRPRRSFLALGAALLGGQLACGGGSPSTSPGTVPSSPPTSSNPCASVSSLSSSEELARRSEAPGKRKADAPRGAPLDALWKHRAGAARGLVDALGATAGRQDVGDVAVVQDQGDVILRANAFDLRNVGLRFTRNGAGGYDVSRVDGSFRSGLGSALRLGDDDSAGQTLAFAFPFFGRGQTSAFVNSDGNITFGEEDRASTERDVSRLLTGPPRVAPFLADLDPSSGGRIFVQSSTSLFTVTWCGVPGFESSQTATVQTTFLPDGTIEMKYADSVGLGDAVVGVSPGRTATFTPVDLSASGTSGSPGAVGERFAARVELDQVALARKFYANHADLYDQLVLFTDQALTRQNTFAFELTVANEIRGLGQDIYDTSREFGSAGRLRSLVMMDNIGKYPDDPQRKFLGEDNALSLLGQECGHRWLAYLSFRDHNGQTSDALLGRDLAHWSFFFDSDASVMEGNDIEDLGGGSFRTVGAVTRYSLLDQYAMGLVPEQDVPPFFYVEGPTNVVPGRTAVDGPEVGVTFNGTRRDVLIDDVVAVLGARQPPAAQAPKVVRQAFVYVVSAGRSTDSAIVSKIERFRQAWTAFFSQATNGRGTAETRLLSSS